MVITYPLVAFLVAVYPITIETIFHLNPCIPRVSGFSWATWVFWLGIPHGAPDPTSDLRPPTSASPRQALQGAASEAWGEAWLSESQAGAKPGELEVEGREVRKGIRGLSFPESWGSNLGSSGLGKRDPRLVI